MHFQIRRHRQSAKVTFQPDPRTAPGHPPRRPDPAFTRLPTLPRPLVDVAARGHHPVPQPQIQPMPRNAQRRRRHAALEDRPSFPEPDDSAVPLGILEVRVDPQALQCGCLYTRDEFPAHPMTRITPRFMHFHAHPTQTQAHRERETR